MNSGVEILLTVCVRTYNQERFIREALDNVLAQKTTFPFEIIVSDDASTDGTAGILSDYQKQYPSLIRVLYNDYNIGGPENLRKVVEASEAKYITCLDGDDYYTDEYKLQKQVTFLENHPEFAACFHNTWHTDVNGRKLGLFNAPDFPAVHDAHEFIRERWFVPIHSAVIRRAYINFPEWYSSVMNDDYVMHLSAVKHAPYYFMSDVMAAYRHHDSNTSRVYNDGMLINSQLCEILEKMKPLYPTEYACDFDERIAYYKHEMAMLSQLERQPWRKWFLRKTYTRMIKKWLS